MSKGDYLLLGNVFYFFFLRNKEPTNVMAVDKKIIRVLDKADVLKQQSLDAENIPDPMDAEQTWPTKEELAMAEEQNKVFICHIDSKYYHNCHCLWVLSTCFMHMF